MEALAERHLLPPHAADRLEALLWLLAEDPLAPTTIRDPWRIAEDHLADSLVAVEIPQIRSASRIVDLGSGAGLPGLPLAFALPEAVFVLIESSSRKCAFLERAIRATGVANAEVVQARAESYPDGLASFDAATARALAPLNVVAEYAAPLLREGGSLIAWRGRRDPEAETTAARACELLGMETGRTIPVQPYPTARNRHLSLMSKVKPTPPEFPRRPGVASKRPLGASDRARR